LRDSEESAPERLRDLIAGIGPRLGLSGALQTGVIWRRWDDIVGPGIAGHAEPTSLRDGVLRIRVASPAWATEIGYLADEIKERANEIAGSPLVGEVRVWSGPARSGVRSALRGELTSRRRASRGASTRTLSRPSKRLTKHGQGGAREAADGAAAAGCETRHGTHRSEVRRCRKSAGRW